MHNKCYKPNVILFLLLQLPLKTLIWIRLIHYKIAKDTVHDILKHHKRTQKGMFKLLIKGKVNESVYCLLIHTIHDQYLPPFLWMLNALQCMHVHTSFFMFEKLCLKVSWHLMECPYQLKCLPCLQGLYEEFSWDEIAMDEIDLRSDRKYPSKYE
jgi:hypothetical protein